MAPGRQIFRFLDEDEAGLVLTYERLDAGARRLAVALSALAAPGDRVILMHAPGSAYVQALLGCFYAGLVAVPAYPPRQNRSMERLGGLVADAGAKLALTTQAALSRLESYIEADAVLARLGWMATDVLPDTVRADDWRAPDIGADSLALLQYTSGSTSAPKGVMLTHGHLSNNVLAMARAVQASEDDRMVSWLPPYHDMGLVSGVLSPMFVGMETLLLSPGAFLQRPLRWLSAITQHRATISGAPNFGFELCARRVTDAQRAQLDLSSWRVAPCGAERVRADTLRRFASAFAPCGFRAEALAPSYGLAEATLAVSFSVGGLRCLDDGAGAATAAAAPPPASVSCGVAVPGVQVEVVDPQTCARLPEGAVGEFWIRGNTVASGYWNKPELTRQTFHATLAGMTDSDWLRSGDLGQIRDGQLHVLGRIKDLIIIHGVNVYPEDVENLVENVHACLRPAGCVAFGVEQEGEERLVIVQELNPGTRDVVLEDVCRSIREHVTAALQLVVHRVVLVAPGGVPRTTSGKVQRGRCRELYLAGQLEVVHDGEAPAKAAPPASQETVDQVARLMAEVLGVQGVGVDDDFLWLGGHSLLATQLASRIRAQFAVDLPLSVIFEATTPRRLAARIAALPATATRPDITPVDRAGRLPLTFSQERMWLLHQLDPGGTAYNVAGALQISGPLDVPRLSRAFTEVEQAHEVLRTRYAVSEGQADVRIVAPRDIQLQAVDLTAVPAPLEQALQRLTQLARTPFDIASEPLLRIALFRVADDGHVLGVCMHHLVVDAWSMGIMVREVLARYKAQGTSQPAAGAAPDVSYVDYAHWQRGFMTGPQHQVQLDYWRTQLQGVGTIELPTDRPRSRRLSSAGELEPVAISDGLMAGVEALARAHGATPFMVMLAAFEVLLYRWTGRSDLVVGVPVANRNWQESEGLMGTLVNTLALRLKFSGEQRFAQLLGEVRRCSLEAYAHQDLSFEKLVTELAVERRAGASPLVSVMFDYQNTPFFDRTQGNLRLHPLVVSRGSAQFDLSLLILDTELGRVAGVEYRSDLFDAATIRRFIGQYLALLEAVILDADAAIDRLPLLPAEERSALLAWSQRSCHPGARIPRLLDVIGRHWQRRASRLAIRDRDSELTYAALEEKVRLLSARLQAQGAGPGGRVAVCLERGVDLPVALLAVLRSGAAYVPLDPGHPRDRLRYVMEDAQPGLLLTQARIENLEVPAGVRVLRLEELCAQPVPAVLPDSAAAVPCDESAPAYVIYTSGSTGRPKGVAVSRLALANFLLSMQQAPAIAEEDRLLSVTTVAFDIAGLELYLPLSVGAAVYVVASDVAADGPKLAGLLTTWNATLMQATPATWRMLIEAGWRGSRNLKILCGGEALPRELADQLVDRAGSVWNMYGPTETTIWSTLQRVTRSDEVSVPIGIPIAETSVYILDQHQQLVPQGVAGEIWIGGLGVANGYFQRPELTAERFLADPFMPADRSAHARMYRTGDAGRYRSDGLLEHLGRLDDQIKIRGFRIEPGEIEQVLKEHAGIRDAVVVAREVRPGDARLIAYYVPAAGSGGALAASELLEALRRRLPAYMIPSAYIAMEAMPLTPNNKIDRRALPTPALDSLAGDGEYVPPSDELEAALAGIWQRLLGVARVGSRDNFFVLGGHSLLAVRLFSQIEKRFGVSLPLSILFEGPTISFLAGAIREARPAQGRSKLFLRRRSADQPAAWRFLVPIQQGGGRFPFFCVHGAGGNVLNLWALARHLGAGQPFYGIQAQGVDGLAAPMDSIEGMAAAYLKELLQVQPAGPYHLGGYCAGGWVVIEMARQLRARGEPVATLALIDCYHPSTTPESAPLRNLLRGVREEGLVFLRRAPDRVLWYLGRLVTRLRVAAHRVAGHPVPLTLRENWLTDAMMRSASHYHPAAYDGEVLLMRARDVDSDLPSAHARMGWSGVFRDDTPVVDVPGDHHTLVDEPHVQELAALIMPLLASSGAPERRAARPGDG